MVAVPACDSTRSEASTMLRMAPRRCAPAGRREPVALDAQACRRRQLVERHRAGQREEDVGPLVWAAGAGRRPARRSWRRSVAAAGQQGDGAQAAAAQAGGVVARGDGIHHDIAGGDRVDAPCHQRVGELLAAVEDAPAVRRMIQASRPA